MKNEGKRFFNIKNGATHELEHFNRFHLIKIKQDLTHEKEGKEDQTGNNNIVNDTIGDEEEPSDITLPDETFILPIKSRDRDLRVVGDKCVAVFELLNNQQKNIWRILNLGGYAKLSRELTRTQKRNMLKRKKKN